MRQLPILLAAFFLFSSLFLLEKPIDNHWFTYTSATVEDNTTTNLLEFISFEDANLTPAEIAIQSKIEDFPSAANIRIVQVNDAKSLQQNGYLGFDFEDGDSLYQFDAFALEVNARSENNYTWMAEIPSHEGGIIINTDSTGTSGYLHFREKQFEIFPLRSDLSFFYEHQPFCEEGIDPNQPPVTDDLVPSGNIDVPPCEGMDCAGLTKVLVLLDQYAQTSLEGTNINLFLTTQIELMNYAFANSNIPHRVKFVYEDFFWDDNERNQNLGPGVEVGTLSENTLAVAARERNNADLIVLLTDFPYKAGVNKGQASLFGESNFGYSIVRLEYLNENVFLHELGHLFRAQHEYPNYRSRDDRPWYCDHAWSIRSYLFTIMHIRSGPRFGGQIDRRVLHFSDPDIYFSIYRTGNIEGQSYPGDYTADNASVIRASGCMISRLKGSIGEYAALINGNSRLCDDPETYTVSIDPSDDNADYEWYITYDGFLENEDNRIPIGDNSDTVFIPKPIVEECSFFFLHVIVRYRINQPLHKPLSESLLPVLQ